MVFKFFSKKNNTKLNNTDNSKANDLENSFNNANKSTVSTNLDNLAPSVNKTTANKPTVYTQIVDEKATSNSTTSTAVTNTPVVNTPIVNNTTTNNNTQANTTNATTSPQIQLNPKPLTLQAKKSAVAPTSDSANKDNSFKSKIDHVFKSIEILFFPFKDIIYKVAPFLKPLVWLISFIYKTIKFIVTFVLIRLYFFKALLKSKFTAVVVVILIILFFAGAVLTRLANSPSYVALIEQQIEQQYGYKVNISGNMVVRVFPTVKLVIKNVNFLHVINNNTVADFKSFAADEILINFKWTKLLLGTLEAKDIIIGNAFVTIKTKSDIALDNNTYYNNLVQNINKRLVQSNNVQNTAPNNNTQQNTDLNKLSDSTPLPTSSTTPSNTLDVSKLIDNSANSTNLNPSINQNNINTAPDNTLNNMASPKPTVSLTNKSSIIAWLLNHLNVNLNVDSIKVVRAKVSIIDYSNNTLATFNNINLNYTATLLSNSKTFTGNLLYLDTLYYYNLKTDLQGNYIANISTASSFENNNVVLIKGTNNAKNGYTGSLQAYGETMIKLIGSNIISNSFSGNYSNNSSLTANYVFNSNKIELSDIKFYYLQNTYSANFKWLVPDSAVHFNIDCTSCTLNVNLPNNKQNIATNFIDATSYYAVEWQKKLLNFFNSNLLVVNVALNNSKVNNLYVKQANLSSFTQNNTLYVSKLNVNTNADNITMFGKLALQNQQGEFVVNSVGSLNQFSIMPYANIVKQVTDNQDYTVSYKVFVQPNRIIFNNIAGNIGNYNFNNYSLTFLDRAGVYDFIANVNLKQANFNNLYNISTAYLNLLQQNPETVFSTNLTTKNNSNNITVNLNIDSFNYKQQKLTDVALVLSANNNGINVKQFKANSPYSGQVYGTLNINLKYTPVLSGNVVLNNFLVDFKDFTNLTSFNTKLSGNAVLNGKIRFVSSNFTNLESIDGNLSFIKQERLKLNIADLVNQEGIYLTLSNNKKNKNIAYINDLIGSVTIKDNKVTFSPVFLLYINNGVQYRGSFGGSLDLSNLMLSLNGNVDNTKNINKHIQFALSGLIGNITKQIKYITTKNNTKAVAVKPKEDILKRNAKENKALNNLNNPNDPNNFNNTYTGKLTNEQKKQLDSLYKQSIPTPDNDLKSTPAKP